MRLQRACVGHSVLHWDNWCGRYDMPVIIATNVTTNVSNGVTLVNSGDELFVPNGIAIYATGATFSGVVSNFSAFIVNYGTILGNSNGLFVGSGNFIVSVTNGKSGVITNVANQGAAVQIESGNGGATVVNDG